MTTSEARRCRQSRWSATRHGVGKGARSRRRAYAAQPSASLIPSGWGPRTRLCWVPGRWPAWRRLGRDIGTADQVGRRPHRAERPAACARTLPGAERHCRRRSRARSRRSKCRPASSTRSCVTPATKRTPRFFSPCGGSSRRLAQTGAELAVPALHQRHLSRAGLATGSAESARGSVRGRCPTRRRHRRTSVGAGAAVGVRNGDVEADAACAEDSHPFAPTGACPAARPGSPRPFG